MGEKIKEPETGREDRRTMGVLDMTLMPPWTSFTKPTLYSLANVQRPVFQVWVFSPETCSGTPHHLEILRTSPNAIKDQNLSSEI